MDHCRAVHYKRGRIAALHQIDQDGAQPRFDYVAAEPEDDRPTLISGLSDERGKLAEVAGSKNVRKAIEENFERRVSLKRPREIAGGDFARARGERLGIDAGKIQGY